MKRFYLESKNVMQRDFLRWSSEQIWYLANQKWNDLFLLDKLQQELERRKNSTYAKNVKYWINVRIRDLQANYQLYPFAWPRTDAPAGQFGFVGDFYWYQQGLLSFVGYHVGKKNGIAKIVRREILKCVILHQLPNVQSVVYMSEWGQPQSSVRLKKLAETIASFARNAKRRDSSMQKAIQDWEEDLAFLRENYYDPKFGFRWPQSD